MPRKPSNSGIRAVVSDNLVPHLFLATFNTPEHADTPARRRSSDRALVVSASRSADVNRQLRANSRLAGKGRGSSGVGYGVRQLRERCRTGPDNSSDWGSQYVADAFGPNRSRSASLTVRRLSESHKTRASKRARIVSRRRASQWDQIVAFPRKIEKPKKGVCARREPAPFTVAGSVLRRVA
jgi:hypothetical protein